MRIFVDASALIALKIPTEPKHINATKFLKNHLESEYFYNNLVYCEVLTVISQRFGLTYAKSFKEYFNSIGLTKLYTDSNEITLAEKILFSQKSKSLSFFDCVYVSLVKSNRLDGIFTYDTDFNKLSVNVLG